MQEWAAADFSVFMPEQTSGILPEQYLQANLANGRELRNQPHIGLFKHFLQHAVQFSRSLLLASLFRPFACIGFTFTSASGKIWCTRFSARPV
jgi:hypothetical protein